MDTKTTPTNEQRERQIKWQEWRSALYNAEQGTARNAARYNRAHGRMMEKASASMHADYHQEKIINQNEQLNQESQNLWEIYQRAVTLDTHLKNALSHGYNLSGFKHEKLDYETCLQACETFMQQYSYLGI